MNIKQIKYFVSVAHHGSLSAAAKDQFITVQAVSKAVADLERELGSKLFVRESRGVHLTTFGRMFLQKAEKALNSFDELEAFALNHESVKIASERLDLMICIPPFHLSGMVCAGIGRFVEKQLRVKTSVRAGLLDDCLRELNEGRIDGIIVVGSAEIPSAEAVKIGTISPALLFSKKHPLASREQISFEEAKDYPFSVPQVFEGFFDFVMKEYADNPYFPAIEQDVDTSAAKYADFVHRGGMMMVTGIESIVGRFPGMCSRPLAPQDSIAMPISLMVGESLHSESLDALVAYLGSSLFKMGLLDDGDSMFR